MTTRLAERLRREPLAPDALRLAYTGQAGFILQTAGQSAAVDVYLSDFLESADGGYKRLIPTVLAPEELQADWLISTHSHEDHLDPGLLSVARALPHLRFAGSPDCRPVYRKYGIPDERTTILAAGQSAVLGNWPVRAIDADHGKLLPTAVGFRIDCAGCGTVYFTGDTSVCPQRLLSSLAGAAVDLMLVPINPAYGNPGAAGAVELIEAIRPRAAIGIHFGMFLEHGGAPAEFLSVARERGVSARVMILAPGEMLTWRNGQITTETAAAFDQRRVAP